ncbi:MAG: hypothetical protein ABEJ81_09225 [Haloferacaceae archaeon]
MPLGGSPTVAWVITVGFLLGFVGPVVYLTYLSVRRDRHMETTHVES